MANVTDVKECILMIGTSQMSVSNRFATTVLQLVQGFSGLIRSSTSSQVQADPSEFRQLRGFTGFPEA